MKIRIEYIGLDGAIQGEPGEKTIEVQPGARFEVPVSWLVTRFEVQE